jgi:hypothetical protein
MKTLIFNATGTDRDGVKRLHEAANAVRKERSEQPIGRLAFSAMLVGHVRAQVVTEEADRPGRHNEVVAAAVDKLNKDKKPAAPDPTQPLVEARA